MIAKISRLGFEKTVGAISEGKSGVVMCCTLNEIMMSESDVEVKEAMGRADILTPDGVPLVWYQRWKYGKGERVYGPDLVRKFNNLTEFKKQLFIGDDKNEEYFKKIGKYLALPFRDSFGENDYKNIASKINKMDVGVVWVGLGARKQVLMADGLKRNGVKLPIVTVGAAFDFLSGNKKQAPQWMQKSGTEWLYRMMIEPKRLTGRYLKIFQFVVVYLCRRSLSFLTIGKIMVKTKK